MSEGDRFSKNPVATYWPRLSPRPSRLTRFDVNALPGRWCVRWTVRSM